MRSRSPGKVPASDDIVSGLADESLIVSEIRYRRLFEAARDGILILDAETGEITDVNPFLIELLSCSREDFLGKKLWEVGFFKDIAESKAKFAELQKKEYIRYENLPLETAAGRRIEVEFVSNVYLEGSKNVIQCNIRDISKRVAKEKQQKLAMQVLAVLNRSNDITLLIEDILQLIKTCTGMEAVALRLHDGDDFPYYVTSGFPVSFVELERHLCARDEAGEVERDPEGNPVLECMCGNVIRGRTNPALPFFTEGGSFWSNCTTELLASTTEKDRQARTRNRCNGEGYESVALIPLRSGEEIIGLLQLNDHRKGMFTLDMIKFFEEMGAGIGIALSRQKMVDEIYTLSKFPSEDKSPVLRIADDGTLLYANPAAMTQLADWHLESGRPAPAELLDIMQRHGVTRNHIEVEYNEQIYSFSVASIPDAGYANLYARDITAHKLADANLRDANARLERSLEELKLMQDKIIQQERLSALGQLASGIAHDFNNVLMPIVGYSDLLMSDPDALEDQEEARHMIEMISSAGKDAVQIVRRLRLVYKKQDDVEREMVDLSKIVESAISMTMPKWKQEMSAKGFAIEIVTNFCSDPLILGNVSELRELMMNLIINATDALSVKGGTIMCRVFRKGDRFIVLEVTDNGIGMDDETRRRCLEPFFSTKGASGSGLGLAMVYGIVQRHGGNVDIESKSEGGTTIRMRFPVFVEAEDTEAEPEKKHESLSPMRILLIDDEERILHIISRLLKHDGHHMEMAGSGHDGLDIFRKGRFDLVITDRAMPGMSGDAVAVEVQKIRPGTPVIMLTGFGEIMKDGGEYPAGVSRVMSKPATREDFRRVMAIVMHKAGDEGEGLKTKAEGRSGRGDRRN